MFHAQELGSYAQGQGSLAVFKVTVRDQGHYKGPSGAFVTYCNVSCFLSVILIFDEILLASNFLVCLHWPADCCENRTRLINK